MIGLHMLHPALAGDRGSSGGGGRRRAESEQEPAIIRVPAKTAPQIVSSVPKCSRTSKSSRAHHQQQQQQQQHQQLAARQLVSRRNAGPTASHRSSQATPSAHPDCDQVLLIVQDDHTKGGGVPIIGRRLPTKSMAAVTRASSADYRPLELAPEQSILNDDYSSLVPTQEHSQAPVIGRRSHRIQQQQQKQLAGNNNTTVYQYECHDSQKQEQLNAEFNRLAHAHAAAAARPAPQPLSIVETHLSGAHLRTATAKAALGQASSAAPAISGAGGGGKLGSGAGSRQRAPIKYPSVMDMASESMGLANEYRLPPMVHQQQQVPSQQQQQQHARKHHLNYTSGVSQKNNPRAPLNASVSASNNNKSSRLALAASSSCTSLYAPPAPSGAGYHHLASSSGYGSPGGDTGGYAPACCPSSGCSPAVGAPPGGGQLCCAPCCLEEAPPAPANYDEPTRLDYDENAGGSLAHSLARSASCQKVPSCCLPPPVPGPFVPSGLSGSQHARRPHHHNHHHNHPPGSQHVRQARTSGQPTGSSPCHRHSCQANSGARPQSATHRSSSCHASRPQEQPMLISGRNVLPVHPKPAPPSYLVPLLQAVNGGSQHDHTAAAAATHHRSSEARAQRQPKGPPAKVTGMATGRCPGHAPQSESLVSDEAAAVTQMYESLAAELKAKLGDPKMGPILLPPRDYDTMSRKQGRLNGIELRRSTNPQLVGPTANRQVPLVVSEKATSSKRVEGSQEQVVLHSSTSSAGSSRSSGRSHTDSAPGERFSQRSRSNSSSGLGSISMGPSSPNELSPSSKLSSNEDMRGQATSRHHHHHQQQQQHTTRSNYEGSRCGRSESSHTIQESSPSEASLSGPGSPIERKNCSPDNCASSDSGHSGSGRLDSNLSSEEQKIMLRDTMDFHFEHKDKRGHGRQQKLSDPRTRGEQVRASSQDVKGKNTSICPESSMGNNGNETGGQRGKGIHHHNPAKVSDGALWNGRVEIPLKVNSAKNTYLATKQIIY